MTRGYVDLHCHILPGVDDGPRTMEGSLEYARLAVEEGTELIVATPHVEEVEVRELPDRVAELRERLRRERIPLAVECGGELKQGSVPQLSDEELDILAHGPPGARWLLYEVPFSGFSEEFHAAAAELRRRGFATVLAHPERADGFGAETADEALRRELDQGALVQMNVGPLCGLEEAPRDRAARHLLRLGLASAMGTDAHPPARPYTLRMGEDAAVAAGAGATEARSLVDEGPRRLLDHGLRRHGSAASRRHIPA
jgi:protein-tyrosine phosphatase